MAGAVLGGVLGAGQWPRPRTSGAQAAGGPIRLRHYCKGQGAGRLPLRQGAEVGGPGGRLALLLPRDGCLPEGLEEGREGIGVRKGTPQGHPHAQAMTPTHTAEATQDLTPITPTSPTSGCWPPHFTSMSATELTQLITSWAAPLPSARRGPQSTSSFSLADESPSLPWAFLTTWQQFCLPTLTLAASTCTRSPRDLTFAHLPHQALSPVRWETVVVPGAAPGLASIQIHMARQMP